MQFVADLVTEAEYKRALIRLFPFRKKGKNRSTSKSKIKE